jgi:gluconate 2-dehydrogenase alpha chain
MGNDPNTSVVNKYGQTWDIPNLFVVGSSTFPSMSGFNPTLTIQALAYMSADAIANKYRKSPGALLKGRAAIPRTSNGQITDTPAPT